MVLELEKEGESVELVVKELEKDGVTLTVFDKDWLLVAVPLGVGLPERERPGLKKGDKEGDAAGRRVKSQSIRSTRFSPRDASISSMVAGS